MRIIAHLRWSVVLGLFLGFAGFGQTANAQDPVISSTFPQAAIPGATVNVKIYGANLVGPTQLWTSFPCEAVMAADVAGNGTAAGEVLYRLKLPADAPIGIYGIRIVTAKGISNLKLFAVDDLPSVAQTHANTTAAAAQVLTVPVAVDGFVNNLTRDYYKFTAAAGQRMSFEVIARRMGSPLDPMIRILDAKGRELAYSDDAPGLGPDSQLSYTFKDAGEYLLEVRDIRFTGSAAFQYRLRIGDFPCVTASYPMGVKRGASASIAFAGITSPDAQPVALNIPGDPNLNWINVSAKAAGGKSSSFAVVSVDSNDEAMEVEPNNEIAQATRVNLGANLNGRFDQPGDIDRFVFTAKMGQHFTFTGVTRTQGSPTDLFMRLQKADGAELAAAEDSGVNEGVIDFTFPADGDYMLVLEDLHRRGGSEFSYHVVVKTFEEKFTLAASANTLNIAQGGMATINVTAVRGKFAGPIVLSVIDAPPGVVATPAVIGVGRVSSAMTIRCDASVPPGKLYSLKILGTSLLGMVEGKAIATVTDAEKVEFGGLTTPPPALAEMIAVGVNPAPLFVLSTNVPEIVFGKDLSTTVKVIATRTPAFGEDIALALFPVKDNLPPGITAALKPIAKATNEIEIVFTAAAAAPLGEFTAVLNGTGKLPTQTSVQPIPALKLSLRAPYVLKPDFAGGIIAKGQTLKMKVAAERNPAYAGPIVLTFQNLPKGVTAAAATIAQGQNEVEIILTAAQDAVVGAVQNVIIAGEGMNGAAKLPGASAPGTLTVQ